MAKVFIFIIIFYNQTSFKKSESRSLINLMSMVWSLFSWSEIFCILKVCLPGTGNDLCHFGCYCGIGQKVWCQLFHRYFYVSAELFWYHNNILDIEILFLWFQPHPPQNDIDQHCKDHDQCWENMITIKNWSNGVREHYQWDLINGKVNLMKIDKILTAYIYKLHSIAQFVLAFKI